MKLFQVLRRLVERHPFASDAALAVALAAFVLSDVFTSGDYLTASKAIYVPAGLLMTLPLAWRRRAPLPVAAVVMGALVFESLAVGSAPTQDAPLVGWLLAIYSVAAHCGRTAALVGGAMSLGAGLVWIGIDDFFFPVVVFGGAWLAGRMVRQREVHAQVVEERSAALDRERMANARAAAAEERARIARELHDVLSHSVSVMVVQAGAERMALGSDRAATGETLEAIERTGRQALIEMRRLLGMLRVGGEPPAHTPNRPCASSTSSLRRCGRPGFPLSFRSRASPLRFRPVSRSPPIASCRRRSPTCSNTPGRRGRG
jgi:signal transduction histidine kinase